MKISTPLMGILFLLSCSGETDKNDTKLLDVSIKRRLTSDKFAYYEDIYFDDCRLNLVSTELNLY